MVTSGVRLGTPAGTTRGFGVAEFRQIGDMIVEVLDVLSQKGVDEDSLIEAAVRDKVKALVQRFPIYQSSSHPRLKVGAQRREGSKAMRCPKCESLDTQVKDSRPTEDSAAIRRRRVCLSCNFRFTTFERVQLRELTVIKRNGRRAAVRPRQARALGRDRAAQAQRRAGADRADGLEDRAGAGKSLGESEVTSRDHRRDA